MPRAVKATKPIESNRIERRFALKSTTEEPIAVA